MLGRMLMQAVRGASRRVSGFTGNSGQASDALEHACKDPLLSKPIVVERVFFSEWIWGWGWHLGGL